ncbi:HpsJ family protein [Pleurocapsa sp. PCC 7319]|uniref:HpsJ-like protein, cyanoexosortase A-associated n=1 Tax=Pleurocapsa sp. PCC 7319 TaxID=118161 RepID=UPI00034C18D9|nr:HpsJ family protein [Pleurocapsa sp. PCC 7319]
MTILQDQERQVFSSGILRLVGYGLLGMAMVDILFLIIPPQLMNPLWEFQTMGAIVERIPVTLLGTVLVYYGERSDRAPIEAILLKCISWLTLVAAILMLLMIPLNISNSFRIYHQQNATANAQFVSQNDTIQQFKEQLKAANSKDEIEVVLQQQAKQQVSIPDSVNTQKLKTDILATVQNNQDNITSQAQTFRVQKRSLLLKKCLKWNLGALIASILFFLIWKSTGWARVKLYLNED